MPRRFKTVELKIKFQIYDDEKKILDKYGYDYESNAAEAAEKHAKFVAYNLKYCEEQMKNSN